MGKTELNITRRTAIAGGAGLVITLALPIGAARAQGAPKPKGPIQPNAYVRVGSDDKVTVLVKHIEFGQGPYTGLATIAAEELDADWSQIHAESAPADAKLYGNPVMGGIQGTGGSSAIASSYDLMRRAGASARAMLVLAAAQSWKVDPATITVERGVIRHASSGREGRFGQFADAAARLPVPPNPTLKDPSRFSLIGRDGLHKLDSAAKSNGSAQFTIDIMAPGTMTVVVARPPRFGAKLKSFDATEALKVRGVKAVKRLSNGVAVYADGTWPALKGRSKLAIDWDSSAAETRGSEEIIADYRALASNRGTVAAKNGDVARALAAGGETIEAEFVFPFLAHAPMEPLDGWLSWNRSGATARFGSQMQTGDHAAIAQVLGLPQDKVKLETMLAGGSFGRRATPTMELAVELAEAAKAIGPDVPVKLIRTREDDIKGGYYRPIFVHRMKGTVKDGAISGWSNTVAGQSFARGTPFESMLIQNGIDQTMLEGASKPPYALADFECSVHIGDTKVPTLWWRSVGHTHTGYAVECFVDELLQRAGKDAVAGRLELMAAEPRAAGVLRAVAALAQWKGPGPFKLDGVQRARGVAVVESFSSFVAQIAEVSLNADGSPRVHKVWCAVDLGVAVNPDVIRAQVEGGIGFAVGHALYAEVPLEGGAVPIGNFDEYRSLRIHEMPEVEVVIVPSTEPPTGIGEPGVPPTAPAIANALARLGQTRPRRLPMVRAA
ncbi:xanthine dehydrogenase family protein molybdopterin-binding subunit [Sphingomonas sp. 1P06PA]|uniref:xanthine dehydrogenase family protein molybdopterin-binding subunit n=1 Tax=Sphingomonas sp. 1P06PA TaxID=554121 RepID=UPI0039A47358